MNPTMRFISGILIFANSIITLPYDGNRFPTTEEMMERLSDLEYRLSLKMLQQLDKCAVEWNGICYFALFYHPGKINREAARLACEKRGAELGNIYAEKQYHDIMEYLRPYISARLDEGTAFGVRTGMRCDPKTQIVYLSNGTKAPFVHWKSGNPQAKSDQTTVLLDLHPEGSKSNGMMDRKPSQGYAAILCQISV